MEFTPAKEFLNNDRLRALIAELLIMFSFISLGMMIVLIPLRYRWTLQTHLSPPVYGDYTNLLLFSSDVFLTLTVISWLTSLALRHRRISLNPKLLTIPLIFLVILSAISINFSVDPLVSLYNTIELLLLFCLYLYLINEIRNLARLIVPIGLLIVIQSIVGITQVLRQHSMGLSSLQELALDPSWKGVSIVWFNGVRFLRAYGLTDHPNLLGGCLGFSLILLTVIYLEARPPLRPWLASVFSLGTLALLLTFSRAAWLGFFIGLVFIVFWTAIARKKGPILLMAGLCFGALLLVAPFLWSYVSVLSSRLNVDGSFTQATPESQSIQERLILNRQAYKIISQHPLTGVGAGAFPEAFQRMDPQYPFDYQPPHNVLLEVAAETGILGGVIYLLVLIIPWVMLIRTWKKYPFSYPLAGISAALLAITIVSFLDYYPWLINSGRSWQWLLWGLWGGIYAGVSKKGSYG